jgi:hypothetical protein
MKILMTVGLILGAAVMFQSQAALQKNSAVKDETKRLELSIVTDRQQYNRHDKLTITAMLVNGEYIKDILVYGGLGWGHLSSLTYTIRDASGNPLHPTILADDLPFPMRSDDTTSFVKLHPNHFLGTNYTETLDRLNLKRPGKYSVLVEYHSPISRDGVNLSNFWSKEDGIIQSNLVHIEVLR